MQHCIAYVSRSNPETEHFFEVAKKIIDNNDNAVYLLILLIF